MSGFLKRIANSAVRRETRLNPLVDPFYVSERREEMPASIEETQTVDLQPRESPGHTPMRELVRDSIQPAPQNEIARTNDGLPNEQKQNPDAMPPRATHPELNSAERGIFQPLLGRVPTGQQMRAERIESPAEANQSIPSEESLRATAQSNSMNAPVESAAESDAKKGSWAYQPLVSPRADTQPQTFPTPSEHVPSAQILQAAAARKEASTQALAQRSAQQARAPIQPEDIQIHIGRIEVIATPQPAPRPAPAPARRGQSLDDYLRSSSGRSR
jgi:hypothetical protein